MRVSGIFITFLLALLIAPSSVFSALSIKSAENKIAIVIGNSAYEHVGGLKNTVNDAHGVEKSLRDLGFDVTTSVNDPSALLFAKLEQFIKRSGRADVVFFYYAGHGAQKDNKNFLLPVDFGAEGRLPLDFSRLVRLLETSSPESAKIFVVDACRNLPEHFAQKFGFGKQRGLARVSLPPAEDKGDATGGYFNVVAFSTAAGATASDGSGDNSPYTESLIKYLPQTGIEAAELFRLVAADVLVSTKGEQRPEFLVQTSRALYFKEAKVTECDQAAGEQENYLGLQGVSFEDVNPSVAVPACEDAVKSDPGSSRLMNNLGRAYERAGRLEDALDWYSKGHRAGNIQATNALGVAYIAGCGLPSPKVEEGVELLMEARLRGSRDAKASLTSHDLTEYVSRDTLARVAGYLHTTFDSAIGAEWREETPAKLKAYQQAHDLAENGLTIETLYAMKLHSNLPKGFKCH